MLSRMVGYFLRLWKSVCVTPFFLLTIEEESPEGKFPSNITHIIHAADMSAHDVNPAEIINPAAPECLQSA